MITTEQRLCVTAWLCAAYLAASNEAWPWIAKGKIDASQQLEST